MVCEEQFPHIKWWVKFINGSQTYLVVSSRSSKSQNSFLALWSCNGSHQGPNWCSPRLAIHVDSIHRLQASDRWNPHVCDKGPTSDEHDFISNL